MISAIAVWKPAMVCLGCLRQGDADLQAEIDAAISALAKSGQLKENTAAYPELVTGVVLPQ